MTWLAAAKANRSAAGAVPLSLAVALAVALLYYSLRGIDWRRVGHLIADAKPGPLVVGAAIAAVSLLLRAFRWRLLLNAAGHVTLSSAFWATASGLFANNFLPARAGEL